MDDSFELFLDTITNTFGGVLLIALLIVLMIRQSKDSAPQVSKSGPTEDMEVVESEIASFEAVRTQLEIDLKAQREFEQDFQNEDLKLLAKELAELTGQNTDQQLKRDSLERQVTRIASQTKEAEADIRRLNQNLASSINERERLSEELAKEQQLRTTTMELPKETATKKSEVPIIVEQDQLFFVNSDRSSNGFSLNKRHFETCSALDSNVDLHINSTFVRTKKGAGVAIQQQAIKREFDNYRSSSSFFTFVVRSNSFDAFAKIRDQSVRSGFEYRIIPTDGVVSESAGTSAKTQ